MKTTVDKLDSVYQTCNSEGIIKTKKEIDFELVKSLYDSANLGFERLQTLGTEFEKKTNNYSFIFRDYYEILRMLIDALLYTDKASISNHQCSNAYLCKNHTDLSLDWEKLETMRILRNAINYEGKQISVEQWKTAKLQFELYIKALKDEVSKFIAK